MTIQEAAARKEIARQKNADRQTRLRIARREQGLEQCNIWVPAGAIPELMRVAELLRADPDLTVGRLVNVKTGRVRGLK